MQGQLSDAELDDLDTFLARVRGGRIGNIKALDGFFAALACCPDLVLPSEYLPVIQSGATEDSDLVFENLAEANQFAGLVMRHWNQVNQQLNEGDVYLPIFLEDETGASCGNDWANGFLAGMDLRTAIWGELMADEEQAGPLIPIMALAYEHHPDPEMRPYEKPIDDKQREELFVGAAAGVMKLHAYFISQRAAYASPSGSTIRSGRKVGRNEPCPCGSGKKFKKCCGGVTLH